MVAGKFQQARSLWQRHQKVRQAALPDFQEKIPVLGLIDLRETEALLNRKQRVKARETFTAARQRLTRKRPFDRLDQNFTYAALATDLQRRLSRPEKSQAPQKRRKSVKGR
jgi:ribose 1,5-bisphosphokinase PhnN